MTAGYTPQHGYVAGRAKDLRMPTSANAAGIRGKITPLMPQGKSARAVAARSRPSSLPVAAVKRTGRTTSAPSLRTNPGVRVARPVGGSRAAPLLPAVGSLPWMAW
jgi:hypothetical protein